MLSPTSDPTGQGSELNTPAPPTGLDRIESAAVRVMHRISTDPKDYGFPDKALRDIAQKIESYRGSSSAVREALISLQRSAAGLAASARHEGISTPYFLFCAALAATDGGRSGRDVVATAQQMMPDLIALRTTFNDDADSSLIVIAAYAEGTGTKKSHPLMVRMRPVVRQNPTANRNIWYLNEQNVVRPEGYDLVLRFLALGIIAQNPKEFGVNAEPLNF